MQCSQILCIICKCGTVGGSGALTRGVSWGSHWVPLLSFHLNNCDRSPILHTFFNVPYFWWHMGLDFRCFKQWQTYLQHFSSTLSRSANYQPVNILLHAYSAKLSMFIEDMSRKKLLELSLWRSCLLEPKGPTRGFMPSYLMVAWVGTLHTIGDFLLLDHRETTRRRSRKILLSNWISQVAVVWPKLRVRLKSASNLMDHRSGCDWKADRSG